MIVPQVHTPTERKKAILITKSENKLLWFIRCQAKRCTEPIMITITITRQGITWEKVKISN